MEKEEERDGEEEGQKEVGGGGWWLFSWHAFHRLFRGFGAAKAFEWVNNRQQRGNQTWSFITQTLVLISAEL